MFMGTNRCFTAGTVATFRSGLEVLGGIWAAANEWTGSEMFREINAPGARDVQDSMVLVRPRDGRISGRTHSMTGEENLAGAGVNLARFGTDFAAWGLGLYPT